MTQRQPQDDGDRTELDDAPPEKEGRTADSPATTESGAMAAEGDPASDAADPRIAASAGTAHGWDTVSATFDDPDASLDDGLVPEGQRSNPGADPTGAETPRTSRGEGSAENPG